MAAGGLGSAYAFINRDEGSSFYAAVAELLLATRKWRQVRRDSLKFHLMLGDRNRLPWAVLGHYPGQRQLVNYYQRSSELCRKADMVALFARVGLDTRAWMPETHIIRPGDLFGLDTRPTDTFLAAHARQPDAIWIAKPTLGSKGCDIKISRDPQAILSHVEGLNKTCVVQRYLDRPLLLPGNRKFDIRLWVLLDPSYRVFVYRHGVVRTASDPYTLDNLDDITSHLTNHCLQAALSPHFGAFEAGNELFFDDFAAFLQTQHHVDFAAAILPQLHRICAQCLEAARPGLHVPLSAPFRSFQLFGFDFLLDEDMHVWLLEINGAPASAARLLPGMARSVVQQIICPQFPLRGAAPPWPADAISDFVLVRP